ncbi:MAG: hypothetical protein ONB46_10045 [candidate division KSB1 bacterium]|nr:hypothetical protein [candidate division KSB1 bacterium]MDZ7366145.1 hypothetical protein [candidate division KSB1 bacterium]MDZ7404213.1 hypothetical protein [candidate division KSB1 bacterium]
MKHPRRIRSVFYAAYLTIVALFAASCSDAPTPGPISPINPADKQLSAKAPDQSTSNTVRPVNRLKSSAVHSLAKSGYNRDKVLQELQVVRDEVKAIADNNPGTYVASKLYDVVKEANGAIAKLIITRSEDDDDDEEDDDDDDRKALDKIKRAKDKLQEAISRRLLLAAQGEQFMNQFIEVENQVRNGYSPSGDYRGRSKSLWIRPNYGGLIAFAGHSIKVPKYATRQDAEFSISISRNDYITVDFGPDGYFAQYVTVTISYKDADLTGIDPSRLTLAWYDETLGQWIDLGGVVDVVQKTVTAKTNHFTQYTISMK